MNLHPFINRETFQPGSVARDDLAAVFHDLFDRGIGAILVVMEKAELPHPGIQGQPQGIFIGGVSPGSLVPVFFFGELRIMNEQVCLGGKGRVIFEIKSSGCLKASSLSVRKTKDRPSSTSLYPIPGFG